jgi:hypothetical protein
MEPARLEENARPASVEFIKWLHLEFYRDAPEELLRIRNANAELIMEQGAPWPALEQLCRTQQDPQAGGPIAGALARPSRHHGLHSMVFTESTRPAYGRKREVIAARRHFRRVPIYRLELIGLLGQWIEIFSP